MSIKIQPGCKEIDTLKKRNQHVIFWHYFHPYTLLILSFDPKNLRKTLYIAALQRCEKNTALTVRPSKTYRQLFYLLFSCPIFLTQFDKSKWKSIVFSMVMMTNRMVIMPRKKLEVNLFTCLSGFISLNTCNFNQNVKLHAFKTLDLDKRSEQKHV